MPSSALGGERRSGIEAEEVKFIAIQQFPLNGVAGVESNSCSQGDWDIDIQLGSRAFGANGLDFQRILGFQFKGSFFHSGFILKK
jgi:hypothetical protein